jgi:hypothetical protein
MKTQEEIKDMLYQYLAGSALKKALSGDVYVDKRPDSSKVEDVVIGGIDLGDGSVQEGAFNVNIHVPALKVKIGNTMEAQPDRKRLRALTRIAVDLLKTKIFEDCSAWVANQALIKEPTLDDWYANIRIEIRAYETD